MGTVVENVVTMIPGTKLRAEGPLLVTHWGMSGPAILKLSSYGARLLAESGYQAPLAVNWTNHRDTEVMTMLDEMMTTSTALLEALISRPPGPLPILWPVP